MSARCEFDHVKVQVVSLNKKLFHTLLGSEMAGSIRIDYIKTKLGK